MSGHTATASYNSTTWFVLLEQARLRQDYRSAAHALDELERLGVSVRFMPGAADEPSQGASRLKRAHGPVGAEGRPPP